MKPDLLRQGRLSDKNNRRIRGPETAGQKKCVRLTTAAADGAVAALAAVKYLQNKPCRAEGAIVPLLLQGRKSQSTRKITC